MATINWKPDHPRRQLRGLAGERHDHDGGEHRRGLSGLRRLLANATLTNTIPLGNTYVIGLDATDSTNDPAIAAGTVIYLNTDQNNTTGYSPFGGVDTVGAEYEVQFALDNNNVLQAYLYSVTAAGARPCSTAARR